MSSFPLEKSHQWIHVVIGSWRIPTCWYGTLTFRAFGCMWLENARAHLYLPTTCHFNVPSGPESSCRCSLLQQLLPYLPSLAKRCGVSSRGRKFSLKKLLHSRPQRLHVFWCMKDLRYIYMLTAKLFGFMVKFKEKIRTSCNMKWWK